MHRSGVRIPLSPPIRRLGIKSHKKRFDKFGQAFFLCSYCTRHQVVAISGVRNNVALRFTTLTAEGHGGRIPLSPPIKSLASVPSFFFIAHASLRSLVRDLQRRQIRWGSSLHSSHAMHRSGVRCLSVAKKFAETPVYGKRQYPLISTIRKAKV